MTRKRFNNNAINPIALLAAHIRVYSSSVYTAAGQGCVHNSWKENMRNELWRIYYV
jgi:hypothetical protein